MLECQNCYNTKHFSFEGMSFKGKLSGIYDGDTITAIVELTPGTFCQLKFRMAGINTPELVGEYHIEGIKARDRVIQLITGSYDENMSRSVLKDFINSNNFYIWIKCGPFEKYGRVLAEIFTSEDCKESLNEILLKEGFAVEYMSNKRKYSALSI